jgi:osmotically-inducible protein OsmY
MLMKHVTRFLSGAAILVLAAGCSPQQRQTADQTGQRVGERVAAGTRNLAEKTSQGLSDAALAGKVRTALQLRQGLDTHRVEVQADSRTGAIRLEGSVPNMQQRAVADEVARNTDGVKSVSNNLAVPPTAVSANHPPSARH